MEVSDYFKDPVYAGIIAGLITALYMYGKNRLNKEPELHMKDYLKPALLNTLMVYFIVSYGIGGKEKISTDPF